MHELRPERERDTSSKADHVGGPCPLFVAALSPSPLRLSGGWSHLCFAFLSFILATFVNTLEKLFRN